MLILHWAEKVDRWTDHSAAAGMFVVCEHTVCNRRGTAQLTAPVKPLFDLDGSTKERQEEDDIPVCVFTDLVKPSGTN